LFATRKPEGQKVIALSVGFLAGLYDSLRLPQVIQPSGKQYDLFTTNKTAIRGQGSGAVS
jgi:hypothetical protein